MTTKPYGVRVLMVNRTMRIEAKERWFRSEAERARWIDQLREKGTLYDVTGYSDPEPESPTA